ncbi:MAG: ABC transporter permease [Trueperaceae bacterium]|nr:MAG: ABC transporter permease [Trueperaceae bacterium]
MTHWRAVSLIARWEFLRFFKLRELALSIVFVVGAFTLAGPILRLVVGDGAGAVRVAVDVAALRASDPLVDAATLLAESAEPLHPRFTFERAADDSLERVRDGSLDAVLRAAAGGGLELVAVDEAPGWTADLEALLGAIVVPLRLQAEGLAPERVAAALEDVTLAVRALDTGPYRGAGLIAVVVGALVFSVFTGAGVLFTVITGEKTQRVTEAIVSAVSPQAWIDGKILGTSLFVLAYLVSYAIGFAIAFFVYGALDGALPQLPALVTDPALGMVTVVFAALGFGLWFTIFAAVAATVSDPTTSSRGGFIMLPGAALSVGFLGLIGDTDGWLFRFFALFPLTSPSALPVRMLAGSVAAWEVLASLALLVAAVLLARRAAAKIFALGIHMTGKEPSAREMWRWLREGSSA